MKSILSSPSPATPAAAAPEPVGAASSSRKTRVLLVDDHPITRKGLQAIIDQQLDLEVCGQTDQAPQAIAMFEKLEPDLAIVDITLKTSNGIELTKQLKALSPAFPVLVVSMHDENLYAERALRAGAMGYVMKQDAGDKVVAAIRRLLQGEVYLSSNLKGRMLQRFVSKRGESPRYSIDTLSDRELEVLQLIGNGYSTRQIAERLHLSPKTIDSYREHLKVKLNLASGAELVRFAIEWGRNGGGA